MKEYHLKQIIGEGATSTIYSACLNNTTNKQEEVAIKILKNTAKTIPHFESEICTLKTVNHPNIIKLHSFHKSQRHLYIIMEKMDMSLTKFVTDNFLYVNFDLPTTEIEKEEYFNERVKKVGKIIRMVFLGVNALHDKGIIHRDIKLGNILVNSKTVKICDFGLSTNKLQNSTFCGTEDYLAPEIINKEKYDSKIDMYGIGLVLFILLTNQKYNESKYITLEDNLNNNERLKVYNQTVKDLLKKLLYKNPVERISTKEALQHEVFREYWCIPDSFINLDDITYPTKLGVIKKEGKKIIFNNIEIIDNNTITLHKCGCINYSPLFLLSSYKINELIKNKQNFKNFQIEIFINEEKYEYFNVPHTDLKKLLFLLKFIKNMRRKIDILKIKGKDLNNSFYKNEEVAFLDIFIKNCVFERKANGDCLYVRIIDTEKPQCLLVEIKYGQFFMQHISIPLKISVEKIFESYNEIIKSYRDSNYSELVYKLEQTDITIITYFLHLSENHASHECIQKQKFTANVLTKFSSDNTTQLINYNPPTFIEIEYKKGLWVLIEETKWRFLFSCGMRIEFNFINGIITPDFSVILNGEENIIKFENFIVHNEIAIIPYLKCIFDSVSEKL